MKSKNRLVFITNIPNQYRIPLFNEMQKQLDEIHWELHVIFGATGYNRRKSQIDFSDCKFNYSVLESGLLNQIEKRTGFMFYSGLNSLLSKLKPDEVIVTGFAISTIKMWLGTFFNKRSYYIVSGSINGKNGATSWAREIQRKLLIQRAKGAIAYGTLAKKYLVALGIKPNKVVCMGNTVDTEFYRSKTALFKQGAAQVNSNQGKKHLTYIGYINARKKVEQLILVLEKLIAYRKDIVLDIIGDGETLGELKNLVIRKNLQDYVAFHGFVQKAELPKYLSLSSTFLFQTSFDIWGLVLNEAMSAGVPCIASVNAGATHDLIQEGVNGFKMKFEEHEQAAQKIDWILNHPDEMEQLGKNASDFINEHYSILKSAKNIISILKS
ncbi:MAG: glycosyltransferase family 4 protein [Salibacteraceae bacterium]